MDDSAFEHCQQSAEEVQRLSIALLVNGLQDVASNQLILLQVHCSAIHAMGSGGTKDVGSAATGRRFHPSAGPPWRPMFVRCFFATALATISMSAITFVQALFSAIDLAR